MYRTFTRISLCNWRTKPAWQMKRKLNHPSADTMTALQLDPLERKLKHLLLDAAAYADKNAACSGGNGGNGGNGASAGGGGGFDLDKSKAKAPDQKIVLRWAGGWVRDKLLGRQSHDIDVAINCMTGETFGNKLRDYCDVLEHKEKHGLRDKDVGSLHKIEKNPEKSKNLEAATVRIFDLDVDFVNLRTETYTEDSRNPQMEFGTAEEDARRRDATVNALFYNIHTDEVEDFVGGLEDMQARVIRTPMDPFQTFMDDPLRVLRLVRFASRLGFAIEPSVKEYMGNESVLKALRVKISRERVGVEVEKMLKGEHPRDAIRYIDELGLYRTVFTDPANSDMPQPTLTGWSTAYEFLHTFMTYPLYDVLVTSEDERYLAWVLACVVPFARVPGQYRPANSKKTLSAATLAAREGLKAPNKVSELITGSVRHRQEILELKQIVCSGNDQMNQRDLFGLAIRKWEAHGAHWRLQVLFAMLDDVMTREQTISQRGPAPAGVDAARHDSAAKAWAASEEEINNIQDSWQLFIRHLQKLDLMDAPSIMPLIDGRALTQALGIKAGKWMAAAMEICLAWQLRNPKEVDPAGAVEEVRQRKEELGIAALLAKKAEA